ncbi:MAG TPA: O-methyltransferase [Anaerolineales bacterium]|nr:O-methyltransferase [Anaerolineales bacterium]
MASFDKINYLLRPSKQVERKLLIEALQKLSRGGYFIQDYTYLGLGSIYYADFILFHKYLSINNMICVEKEDIPKRMGFNKPYEFITLKMSPVSDIIPTLNRESPYFIWLDYDSALDRNKLDDIRSCIRIMSPGSVFLVTLAADPVQLNDLLSYEDTKDIDESQKQLKKCGILSDLIGAHLGRQVNVGDITRRKLPLTYATAVRNYINTCLDTRPETRFYQLFNFVYADNMQMMSFGGIIDNDNSSAKIDKSGVYELDFITLDAKPIVISAPPLTIREKSWLEKHMVMNPNPPLELEFEIEKDFIDVFLKYYRHYPVYYETLV